MDPDKLFALLSWHLLWVTSLAFALGAVGALLRGGRVKDANGATDGWATVLQILGGGVAAVAILYATQPETAIALVSGSLVAGYASKAILAALEARAVAQVAKEAAKEAKDDAKRARAEADAARLARDDARGDARKASDEVTASREQQSEARTAMADFLAKVARLDARPPDAPTTVHEVRAAAADLERRHFARGPA